MYGSDIFFKLASLVEYAEYVNSMLLVCELNRKEMSKVL